MHDDIRIEGEITHLYHGTTTERIRSIKEEGLRADTCWGTYEMAAHFARVECRETGGRPVMVARRLDAFAPETLVPDEDAVDFPMTEVFGGSYDVLGNAWETGDQSWEECLRLCRSVVCTEVVAVTDDHVLEGSARFPEREPDEPALAPGLGG